MASIHIEDIRNLLAERGAKDALPNQENGEGYFLEIRFDAPNCVSDESIDKEFQNRVITIDCPYGTVTIVCDENGQLRTIDLS